MIRLVADSVKRGRGMLIQQLQSALTGRQTTKQKRINMIDGILRVNFQTGKGKDFEIGIDVKYSSKKSRLGPKYVRGFEREKKVETLETLFVEGHLNDITYLLTNLYYHNQNDPAYQNYYEQIIQVALLVSGLLTLLPAGKSFANFNNPRMIGNVLRRDKRIFVIINDKLYLMTTFLWGVFDSLFSGKPYKSKDKDSLKILKDSLEAILSTITSPAVGGAMYEAKKPIISSIKGQPDGYRELKPVVDLFTGNKLLQWKYLSFTTPLVVQDAKNK
jgi:hypothetical protein